MSLNALTTSAGRLLAQAPFGDIDAPAGVVDFNTAAGGPDAIGLLLFLRNIILLFIIIAGIWTLFNIVMAGFQYVTAQGDSGAHQKVREKITMSIIGLVIMVSSFTIMGLLGGLLFGDPTFFLNPVIQGP